VKQGFSGAPSFGILSTYPPKGCGVAMFSSALPDALTANGAELSVVRVADGPSSSSRVVGELVNGSTTSIAKSADIEHHKSVRVPMNNRQLSATIRHPDTSARPQTAI
jgi:polysaccharide biosynthesis protein PslF